MQLLNLIKVQLLSRYQFHDCSGRCALGTWAFCYKDIAHACYSVLERIYQEAVSGTMEALSRGKIIEVKELEINFIKPQEHGSKAKQQFTYASQKWTPQQEPRLH